MPQDQSEDFARLYLATPRLAEVEPFLPRLSAALAAAEVASLLLRLETLPPAAAERAISAVAAIAQPAGVALLIEGEPELVSRCGADGLHLPYAEKRLAAAIKRLSPDFIVGVGALASRDEAMRAGEAGADYLLFGDIGEDGAPPSLEWTAERVAWWAEIFNTPCVALAHSLAEVGPLSAAGAEFVSLDAAVWDDPRGPAEAMREAARLVREAAK
ncbi:thiamine phosphate synthase [Methylosinus sp. LW4]|uniref:thiamine phosphate synthase n=1 Tax=Methylosinus sp. LW4 TaxID=136993 RepID=UPI00036DEC22|nr:thiamine phosphate synthase [Methylosinus sp. LW4]